MEHILPLPLSSAQSTSKGTDMDEVAWTDRILITMKYLDEKTTSALLTVAGLKQMYVALPLRDLLN